MPRETTKASIGHPLSATSQASTLALELSGLDALELTHPPAARRSRSLWSQIWPRLLTVVVFTSAWQLLVWSGWRPREVLPGPWVVAGRLADLASDEAFWAAITVTLRRALTGFALSAMVGSVIGLAAAASRTVRVAIGSFITGLETMPSIAWLPLAVLVFHLGEAAVICVVVLGAAPSIANGLLAGIDVVPPLLRRAGHVVGARGVSLYRHVILPAALPGYVSGLKQGWAFAWRGLMAGELLVAIAGRPSLGERLQIARQRSDTPALLATMTVVLVIGIVVDVAFGRVDLALRRRRGLVS